MMWALTVGWLSVDRRLTVGFGPIQDRFEGVLLISGFRYYGITFSQIIAQITALFLKKQFGTVFVKRNIEH